MSSAPVIVLAPPHSFTSVVCAMLGQHPQLYDLPEVNLFVAETMRERDFDAGRQPLRQHGLLRAVAELYYGEQSFRTVVKAHRWVQSRVDQDCVSVFDELAEKVQPRILVDKSPLTTTQCEHLLRLWRSHPSARFIHLSRHPVSYIQSVRRRQAVLPDGPLTASRRPPRERGAGVEPGIRDWYRRHANVIAFLGGVPSDQKLAMRGEDLISDPEPHLRKIVEWLGLETDEAALEAMTHPERSPYACFGPANAKFGNDPGFQEAPELRRGSFTCLEGALGPGREGASFSDEVVALARELGYT